MDDPRLYVPLPVYEAALAEVNSIRAELGGEPLSRIPKGMRGICAQCPIAHALEDLIPGVRVGSYWISQGLDFDSIRETPYAIRKFVTSFDNTYYVPTPE